jgi:folate-binding protein YgfZ
MNTLKVSGPDAEKFLQGQVTCNVNTLLEKKSQLCALCNRKGRVIASFNIIKEKDYFLMVLAEDMVEVAFKALDKYAKFSKTTLEIIKTNQPNDILNNNIKIVTPETSGQFTPHKLNYHLIDGMIDFNKGCYTGQEIIARVHYLSKPKKKDEG